MSEYSAKIINGDLSLFPLPEKRFIHEDIMDGFNMF